MFPESCWSYAINNNNKVDYQCYQYYQHVEMLSIKAVLKANGVQTSSSKVTDGNNNHNNYLASLSLHFYLRLWTEADKLKWFHTHTVAPWQFCRCTSSFWEWLFANMDKYFNGRRLQCVIVCRVGAECFGGVFARSLKRHFWKSEHLCSLTLQDTASSHEPLFTFNYRAEIHLTSL